MRYHFRVTLVCCAIALFLWQTRAHTMFAFEGDCPSLMCEAFVVGQDRFCGCSESYRSRHHCAVVLSLSGCRVMRCLLLWGVCPPDCVNAISKCRLRIEFACVWSVCSGAGQFCLSLCADCVSSSATVMTIMGSSSTCATNRARSAQTNTDRHPELRE